MAILAPGDLGLDLSQLQDAFDPTYRSDIPNRNGEFGGEIGVVVGAGDPEADGIEREAWHLGVPVMHARAKDGSRVGPGNTYEAVPDPRYANFNTLVTVETAVHSLGSLGVRVIEIDHHGERGPACLSRYGNDPSQRSSFGQFARVFGIELDEVHSLVGGLDDCAHMMLGDKVKGASPHKSRLVMEHEIVRGARKEPKPSLASRQEVHDKVDAFGAELDTASLVRIGGVWVREFRDHPMKGAGYSEDTLALKTAASLHEQVAIAYEPDARAGQANKVIFTGAVTPAYVEAFLRFVEEASLEYPIVDPRRGIAKAYLPGERDRVAGLNY